MSEQGAERYPRVQGRCPACGSESLFLGSGGYVTCSCRPCPDPCGAADLLDRTATLARELVEARERLARVAVVLERAEQGADAWGTCCGEWLRINELRAALHAPADAPQGGSEGLMGAGEGDSSREAMERRRKR